MATVDEVKDYMEYYKLKEAIADAVNDAVAARSTDPLEHIATFLKGVAKPVRAGYGFSEAEDVDAAVEAAVKAAGVPAASFGFISCTVTRDPAKVCAAFAAKLPGTALHGVTSCGNILQSGKAEAGVACLLFSAPGGFETAFAAEPAAAAEALKAKCAAPSAIIMGTVPGSEEGAIAALGEAFPGVPVWGGTAADNELNGSWRILTAEGAKEGGLSLVAVVEGKVKMGASMLGPYTPTEKIATVTKATGRKVFEFDGGSALKWTSDWLGDAVAEQAEKGGLVLPATADKPIAVSKGESFVPAHLAALDPTDGSVDFFAPMAEGDKLVVMSAGDGPEKGYATTLSEAYDAAAAAAAISAPAAGVLLYCGGMSIAVGDNLSKGLSDGGFTAKVAGLPMLGMTVFGEQSCMAHGNCQRNLSMGFLLFE